MGPPRRQPSSRGSGEHGGEAVLSAAAGRRAGCAGTAVILGRVLICCTSSLSASRAIPRPGSEAKMPALHIEDLPEKEKLKMEVEQLRKEVKLQRQQVNCPRAFPSLKSTKGSFSWFVTVKQYCFSGFCYLPPPPPQLLLK